MLNFNSSISRRHGMLAMAILLSGGSVAIGKNQNSARIDGIYTDRLSLRCQFLDASYPPYQENFVQVNESYFTLSMSRPAFGSRAASSSSGEADWDGSSLLPFLYPGQMMAEPPLTAGLPGDLDMWWKRARRVVATGSSRPRKSVQIARELELLESRLLLSYTSTRDLPPRWSTPKSLKAF